MNGDLSLVSSPWSVAHSQRRRRTTDYRSLTTDSHANKHLAGAARADRAEPGAALPGGDRQPADALWSTTGRGAGAAAAAHPVWCRGRQPRAARAGDG